ncbi:MAG: archaeosortase/exosortase family protein [Candidatus Methylumidiphilus sp.]
MAKVLASVTVPADWISDFLKKLADLLRHSSVLPLLQVSALWPVWRWYWARLGDGSDEPLGPLALVLALWLLFERRRDWRRVPKAAPLLAAGVLTLAQAAAGECPPLLRALLGVTALGLCLAAFLPRAADAAPLWALLALSLPLLASLQFYGGYPLRLFAAEGAGLLLHGFGLPVVAEGAGLRGHGQLVLVDAPCSGVHMLWVGLVMACAASAVARAGLPRLVLNGSVALALVLLGNMLRNAALFIKETGVLDWPDWTHDAIGIAVFALVLGPVALFSLGTALPGLGRGKMDLEIPQPSLPVSPAWDFENTRNHTIAAVLLFVAAAVWGGFAADKIESTMFEADPPWPTHFQGSELIHLPLPPAEARWLRDFPGAAARFTDGGRELLIRHVERPTRMLHPAADCFKGLGYTVAQAKIREFGGARWSCFNVRKDGISREVCERIYDAHGGAWTDASAWYWYALLQRGGGPWWAVTVVGE